MFSPLFVTNYCLVQGFFFFFWDVFRHNFSFSPPQKKKKNQIFNVLFLGILNQPPGFKK